MKAIILAAGKGTRMLPLTEEIPKALIPVNGKPFLWYVIENVRKAGFDEIGIVAGYKKEKIREFVEKYNLNATLLLQEEQQGTGHAVMAARDFVGDSNFIVHYGDNLCSEHDLKKVLVDDDLTYIAGMRVKEWKKYGILVEDEHGFLKEKIEKPEEFVGDVAWPGFFKSTPDLFGKLQQIGFSVRNEIEVTDALNLLAQQKKVKVIHLEGFWLDLGCKEDIPEVERFLKREKFHHSPQYKDF